MRLRALQVVLIDCFSWPIRNERAGSERGTDERHAGKIPVQQIL